MPESLERNNSTSTQTEYNNLNELRAPAPIQIPHEAGTSAHEEHLERHETTSSRWSRRRSSVASAHHPPNEYNIPDKYANLNELGATSPIENVGEEREYTASFLEDTRSHEQEFEHELDRQRTRRRSSVGAQGQRPEALVETSSSEAREEEPQESKGISKYWTTIYTLSYLVLFSFLGTLARVGIEALTSYPGYPVTTTVLWANFAGSMFMGFLSEDRMLFKHHHNDQNESEKRNDENSPNASPPVETDNEAAKKAHLAIKKTIPLYIGLTTGFCGSFTSFSSFIRDVFLELSNTAPTLDGDIPSRNGGYSFMALVGVIILTVCLCLSAIQLGGHLAIATERLAPPGLPIYFTQKVLDRGTLVLAWTMWLGAIFMAIWPPDRPSGPAAGGRTSWAEETWRGQVIFSLVFAPLGTLMRFYAAIYMNGILVGFPLGTFAVNVFGTVVLGMAWDLQHAPLGSSMQNIGGGIVGCQVLQGIQDGFCGCLTTVSTWVLELTSLRRRHAYWYGAMSVGLSLAFLVVIMGTLQWTHGFEKPACSI